MGSNKSIMTKFILIPQNTTTKNMRKYFNWLILKKIPYTPLDDTVYYRRFGIELDPVSKIRRVVNKNLLEKAYSKAWENRDYEIDKFWTRATYFWGFIVLIFGGYIALLTGDNTEKALNMHLDLFLILLGILFSISWYLVILGSKSWQKNWEEHIDYLEDFITGPLYKTVYLSGNRIYSVSKLNEVMAIVVIFVWGGLFLQHLMENFRLSFCKPTDWTATIAIALASIFSIILIFGYSSGKYKSKKNKFIDRWEVKC